MMHADIQLHCGNGNASRVDFILNAVYETSNVGDVNLDGYFDSGDLVDMFIKGKYQDINGAEWSDGDINCDGFFDSGDLVEMFQAGHYATGAPVYELPPIEEQVSYVFNRLREFAWYNYLDANENDLYEESDIAAVVSGFTPGDYNFDGAVDDLDIPLARDVQNELSIAFQLHAIWGSPSDALRLNHVNGNPFPFDLNGDMQVSPLSELGDLCRNLAGGNTHPRQDLNDDGTVNVADFNIAVDEFDWVLGDRIISIPTEANGVVDQAEVDYFIGLTESTSWWRQDMIGNFSQGDLNCDGRITNEDVDIALANFQDG